MKRYIPILLAIFMFNTESNAQKTEVAKKDTIYPYILPIWGQKMAESGRGGLLPFGLNVNYTYNSMDLYVSEFALNIGDDPNSSLNTLLDEYVSLETLNFQAVTASTNGLNLRADVFVFPFMSVYGIYASNHGNTTVSLQPEWYEDNGDLILSLPEFGSSVDFDANSLGIGTTLAYGIKDYFISYDINYTSSTTALLNQPVQLMTSSMRVGTNIKFKNPERKIAVYVGAMYRGFVDAQGNSGNIKLNEVFPELGTNAFSAINDRTVGNNIQITANNEAINALNPNRPQDQLKITVLETSNNTLIKKNEGLATLDNSLQTLVAEDVNYSIKKELINNWSVQFGFNFQINKHWMYRGEFGHQAGNTFILTGLQYRFGL